MDLRPGAVRERGISELMSVKPEQTPWDFAEGDSGFAEVHLAGATTTEKDGFVIKEVLRTGEWPVIPTGNGLVKKPLRIVRDGLSSKEQGVLAMEEIVANFKAGAITNPQIPLSDDKNDHKNLTRVNTGFIRDLWIEDKEGGSRLVAKMDFTEPDVKEKVLRGTFADVSSGIPWNIRSRGKEFGATLEHVAITNRPFIDGLGPFSLAASDNTEEVEVTHFGEVAEVIKPEEVKEEVEVPEIPENQKPLLAKQALIDQFGGNYLANSSLSSYTVTYSSGSNSFKITNPVENKTWTVPYTTYLNTGTSTGGIKLGEFGEWKAVEEKEVKEVVGEKKSDEVAVLPKDGALREIIEASDLEKSHHLRELRLSQPNGNGSGGSAMSSNATVSSLDGLELSDEARAAIQSVLDENANLRSRTREQDADARIEELKGLGLGERPGALKLYRQVFLSDDGGPAVVLLSDNGKDKKQMTALEVLDSFLDGIKGSDGSVALSDQHLVSGNDKKPPEDANAEKPVAERLAEAKSALYGN